MKSPIFLLTVLLSLTTICSNAQTSNLSIQVVDELGEPLPGANIIYENSISDGIPTGTTADAEGVFHLQESAKPEISQTESIAPDTDKDEQDPGSEDPEQEHILVSFLGYESTRIPVKEAAQMNKIVMTETSLLCNEVVIEASTATTSSITRTIYVSYDCLKPISKEAATEKDERVSEPAPALDIKVFPNPAQSQMQVSSETQLGTIQIFDYLGKQWASYNFGEITRATVNINDLPKGSYLLVTEAGEALKFQKID